MKCWFRHHWVRTSDPELTVCVKCGDSYRLRMSPVTSKDIKKGAIQNAEIEVAAELRRDPPHKRVQNIKINPNLVQNIKINPNLVEPHPMYHDKEEME